MVFWLKVLYLGSLRNDQIVMEGYAIFGSVYVIFLLLSPCIPGLISFFIVGSNTTAHPL